MLQMESKMDVELNVHENVKESFNIQIKDPELDNHDFLSLEDLQLAGPSTRAQPSQLKTHQAEKITVIQFRIFLFSHYSIF